MDKFFIIGCPRSGTTMVQQALNRHSQIAIPPETKFFFSFLGQSAGAQRRHLERLSADLGVRLGLPPEGVQTDDEARGFYEQMAAKYVARLGKTGVTRFGEKTPEHTGHLDRIRDLYPAAKVIVLYRDGRDVALSLSRTPWAPAGLYANFVIWLYYQKIVTAARSREDPNLHFVRYEDVVDSPEESFHNMLTFLGLPYESAVAVGHGNREGVPARELSWKAAAVGKITTERAGAFRRELAPDQIAVLERLGRETLTAFGYPLVTDGGRRLTPRVLARIAFDLSRFVARLPWYTVARELAARGRAALSPAPHWPAPGGPAAGDLVRTAAR
jgi:hypothetical protein